LSIFRFSNTRIKLSVLVSACFLIASCKHLKTPIPAQQAAEIIPDKNTTTPIPTIAAFCALKDPSSTNCNQPVTLPAGFKPYTEVVPKPGEGAFATPGNGGICCGQLAVVARDQVDITVSRAWSPHYENSAQQPADYYAAYQYGGYWSLGTLPTSQQIYRSQADVCANYNSLTTYSVCKIKPGTVVAIGPGQSASCTAGPSYPQSPSLQIMIVGNAEDSVWRCSSYAWPQTPPPPLDANKAVLD